MWLTMCCEIGAYFSLDYIQDYCQATLNTATLWPIEPIGNCLAPVTLGTIMHKDGATVYSHMGAEYGLQDPECSRQNSVWAEKQTSVAS